jgi:dihydroorotate dehydrogenase
MNTWLDHVYKNSIWIYSSKKERLNATRLVLGYKGEQREFRFEDTINWSNLSSAEEKCWRDVSKWVSWFCKEYSYIENDYTNSLKMGHDVAEIKYDIMIRHICNTNKLVDYEILNILCPNTEDSAKVRKEKNKRINDFVDFLIDCFENRIK